MKRPWIICVALIVAVLAVFGRALESDFVDYDDPAYITSNQHVRHGLTREDVAWAFTSGEASNWHPLTWLSHMADAQVFGMKPAGHHLTSVLLHAANAALLFLLLRGMTGRFWPSAVVAALFALHPLRVESVAWVSERKDVLSTFFWILTVWAYAGYVSRRRDAAVENKRTEQTQKPSGKSSEIGRHAKQPDASSRVSVPSWVCYSLALFLFALGLMAKPMLVTLPFVLLLLDYWPLGRISLSNEVASEGRLFPLVLEKLPFFVISAGSCVVTFLVQRHGGAVSTVLPLSARLANAAVSYARYLGKTFWPARLSVLYPHPGHWPVWMVGAALALLMGITLAAVWRVRQQPYFLVGWLWFLGILAPTIGLVQVGLQSMADRYSYVPLVGIFIILVWGLDELAGGGETGNLVRVGASALAIAASAFLTVRQTGFWRDSETLFQHAVEVTDNNYLAYNNLGFFLSGKGEKARAKKYFEDSLKINPNYDEAHNNLGFALAGEGKYQEALPEYEAALRINPKLTEAHNNYGNALAAVGRVDEAIREYQIALTENLHHADAHNNLGNALAQRGQLDAAIEEFREAIRDKDNYVGAHSNLGNAYAMQGKFDQAMQEYRISLQIDPTDAQAHNNLANVLAQKGQFDEAIQHYFLALKLKPENPEAHFNLGYCYLRLGKRAEAEREYEEALKQRPDYAAARQQLAALRAGGK
jgi:tetratricopeptide (TPR) repeat protein